MQKLFKPVTLALALIVLAAIAAGCGESESEQAVKAAGAEDRAFIAASIALNERAAEMSKLVAENGKSEELKTFAATVAGERSKEIEQLKSYAAELGVDTSAAVTDEVLKPLGWTQNDLYLDADADKLADAEGSAFDALYLKLLIQNAEGAMRAARPQVTEGGADKLVEEAQLLISARSLEHEKAEKLQKKIEG